MERWLLISGSDLRPNLQFVSENVHFQQVFVLTIIYVRGIAITIPFLRFFPFHSFFCMRRLNRIAGNFRNHIWAFFCWWNNRKMPNYQQRSKCIRKDQKSPDLYWNGENIPWDTWQRNDSIQSMCHIKDINAAEWLTWQKREVSQWSVITSHCSVFIWISSINTTSTAVEHGYTREPILQLHVVCSYHISTTIEHLSSITSMRCISHISIPSQQDHSFTSPHRGQLA